VGGSGCRKGIALTDNANAMPITETITAFITENMLLEFWEFTILEIMRNLKRC